MSRRSRWQLALSSLPFLTGGGYWLLVFQFNWLPEQVVYMRASLAILVLGVGTVLTLLLYTVLLSTWRQQSRAETAVADAIADKNQAHRQFLLRLDHELKNPLTALQVELANLEALAPVDDPTSEGGQTLLRLKTQANRLSELVIPLRKIAELDTREIESAQVDLARLISDVVTEFQLTEAGLARRISLNLPQLPWPLPEVQGDADLLFLAFHNVLGNAVKFTRPGDAIQVRAFEDDRRVVIEIADTGPGVPPDELPHVWDELYRGKLARGTPGSGLGLALVKGILERHGGEVAMRSRLQQGTIVTFTLPARA